MHSESTALYPIEQRPGLTRRSFDLPRRAWCCSVCWGFARLEKFSAKFSRMAGISFLRRLVIVILERTSGFTGMVQPVERPLNRLLDRLDAGLDEFGGDR